MCVMNLVNANFPSNYLSLGLVLNEINSIVYKWLNVEISGGSWSI